MQNIQVCDWCKNHFLLRTYHDNEWGIPKHDDRIHFEYLTLETMQCGLNWLQILKKREAIREAFCDFDYCKIAKFTDVEITRALNINSMIKSPKKINAVVNNAKIFMNLQNEYKSFDNWIWSYTDYHTLVYSAHSNAFCVSNEISDKISKELRNRGMKFIGSITIYAHLQAAGLINDHEEKCWMHKYICDNFPVRYL